MKLTHTCIITKDVKRLTDFYKKLLQTTPAVEMDIYAEFELGEAKLSMFDFEAHNKVVPNSLAPENNHSMLIEIAVDDVDAEYDRLCKENIVVVTKPEDQFWGIRSFYFKDCDGNLLDFYKRLENN